MHSKQKKHPRSIAEVFLTVDVMPDMSACNIQGDSLNTRKHFLRFLHNKALTVGMRLGIYFVV